MTIFISNSFAQFSEEEDLIFCSLKVNSKIKLKLTKTNDELYSFYIENKKNPKNIFWDKVMDLGEPVVWTKDDQTQVTDFYDIYSYSYWVRLTFNNDFESDGNGLLLEPTEDYVTYEDALELINCRGTLK